MANNGVPVQYYIDASNFGLCLLITHSWFGACFLFTERASLRQYIDGTILFGFGPYPLMTQGLSVRQYMTQWSKKCRHLFGACSLFVKKSPSFGQYRPEKEIFYFNKSSNFEQTSIVTVPDHYSTITILLDPLPFHCTLPLITINIAKICRIYNPLFLWQCRKLVVLKYIHKTQLFGLWCSFLLPVLW